MAIALNTLLVEQREDGTALITIHRPGKRDPTNHAFFHDLPATLAALDACPGIHACVITGVDDAFSDGGGLADCERLANSLTRRRQFRLTVGAFHALERCETVTIGAVNGVASSGGTELTLACDLAIASTRARFAFDEATLALMPGSGRARWSRPSGHAQARWLALSGEDIDAEQALKMGLVQWVVPPEDLLQAALTLAGSPDHTSPDYEPSR